MDEKSNLKDELVAEFKQEPEILDMTPLAGIKSIMRQALGYDDLTPIDLTKHISVALRSSSGSNAIAEREAGSDILRFFASGEYPAASLKVSIVPVQEGTGDPSPDNVRPITGWTAVKVYQAAEYDEEAEPVLEVALGDDAGTVYGGTLDVVTGVLTVNTLLIKQFPISVKNEVGDFVRITSVYSLAFTGGDNDICNISPYLKSYTNESLHFYCQGATIISFWPKSLFDDLESTTIGAWLDENCTVMAHLTTPVTFQLDPEELSTLTTLIGENNIWADCGPVESITY